MALAFLDNAFESVSSPTDIFSRENITRREVLIRIRESKMVLPILRKVDGATRRVSETEPVT